ncbi:MAG: sterol desaturase family protein [Candidatus Velthaea sp.]
MEITAAWGTAILALELLRPLRAATESKIARDGRNAGVAAFAAVPVALLETPIALALAKYVEKRRWGLVNRLPVPPVMRDAAAVLALDYTLYLWHVLTHRVPFLWRFHLVHHVDRDLDASTALRFHFGEMAISVLWRAAQVSAIGVSPRAFAVWQQLLVGAILFHHSNVRLPARYERAIALFVVTPRAHGLHHAADERLTNANWSSGLSCWDRLHGTWREPDPADDFVIGVPAYRSDGDVGLVAMLALPFEQQRDAWTAADE